MMIQLDAALLLLRLEQLGYCGLGLQTLRRLTWEVLRRIRNEEDILPVFDA